MPLLFALAKSWIRLSEYYPLRQIPQTLGLQVGAAVFLQVMQKDLLLGYVQSVLQAQEEISKRCHPEVVVLRTVKATNS